MSYIFTLKSNNHILFINFTNPIELDPDSNYGLAFIGFHSYNSIPNIEEGENKFYFTDTSINNSQQQIVTIPTGSYEICDIEAFLREQIIPKNIKYDLYDKYLSIKPNNNTLQCEIYSEKYKIDFTPIDSIGRILGYSRRTLYENKINKSDIPVEIVKVRTIQINCNITTGAFYKDRQSHTIYEFPIDVDPGYAINELPKHLIYLPLINKREIPNITLNILDQDFRPVNFRGEEQIVRLELKKLS